MATLPIEAQRDAVATLFLSYLGRAPEFEAMEHYTKLFAGLLNAQGNSETAQEDAFKALSAQIYADAVGASEVPPVGNTFTYTDYVNWIYQNVLGRAADEDGLDYWVSELEIGRIEAAELVAIVVAAAEGDERDAAYVANRTEVAVAYAKWEVSNPAKHAANPELSASILQFVTEDPATVDAALQELSDVEVVGQTYTLTQGVDTVAGTAANDTINALYVTVDGTERSTLTAFDAIDGGAGHDTLNIHTKGSANGEFPADVTVKNVETVNIYNSGTAAWSLADASNYEGVTALWQIGAEAAYVTGLQSTTVAGFKGAAAQDLGVVLAADATTANVALDQVSDAAELFIGGLALDTVNLTGELRGVGDSTDDLELRIVAGSKATTVTLNTDIDVDLDLWGAKVDTLDASGSTGDVSLGFSVEVQSIALGNLGNGNNRTYTIELGDFTLTTDRISGRPTAEELAAAFRAVDGYDDAPFSVEADGSNLILTWNDSGSVPTLARLEVLNRWGNFDRERTATMIEDGGRNELPSLHTVLTGEGDDFVASKFVTTKQQGATISTGAGDDVIAVATSGNGLTTVDAGAGDDVVMLVKADGNQLRVDAGDGDDVVIIDGQSLQATDLIDGGEGDDIVALAVSGKLVADHYVVLNKVITNFETLALHEEDSDFAIYAPGYSLDLDAAQLSANYTELQFFHRSTNIVNVGTQSLVVDGDLRAVAAGTTFKPDTGNTEASTLAGTLNITAIGALDETDDGYFYPEITAYAETVNLTVDASEGDVAVQLLGDAKTANVTLVQELNDAGDDYVGQAVFFLNTSEYDELSFDDEDDDGLFLPNLASLTLSGNGVALVINGQDSALVEVDASGMLDSINEDDRDGLIYISANAKAETISLGEGQDGLLLGASTYAAIDTVEGLTLVAKDGKLDEDLSDVIRVGHFVDEDDDIDWIAAEGFKKFTTTQTDLDLALKEAAASADGYLVFHLEGDTYIYQDSTNAGLLDADDGVVKLIGTIDLDLLIESLNGHVV